ncbi:protein lin-9 homolog isoform X1 [Watersipora subatra]|uniref:protein lin-9 homolog isoform X1 n=1 Tax=Watersipora subatra TaxID=2589382 RepID=UPI00355B39EB
MADAKVVRDGIASARKRPSRNVKRNRRITQQDAKSESPRKQAKPAPILKSEKEIAQSNGLRLKNILKLPKAHKWVCYEWFYSTLDQALLLGGNDFQAVLRENFPDLGTELMRKSEWNKIRRLMGKPRRCSAAFFQEERNNLEQRRQKIRLIQQRKMTELSEADMKDLPDQIPLPLVIGTGVTALLRSPQDGLYAGTIDAVDTMNNTYRITFDRAGLGTHTVPDYEVLSNRLQDTIPLSSFQHRIRPARYTGTISPPHRSSHLQLDNDPLLGFAPLHSRLLGDQSGTIGGFPVKFLVQVTKLSKSLSIKREKVDELKSMNAKAEKFQSYLEPLSVEFQKRYAYDILELEEINRRLEEQLSAVQIYSHELSMEQGVDGADTSQETRHGCDLEAKAMFERRMEDLKCTIQSPSMAALITKLTAMLLQLKAVSEGDVNALDLRSIQNALEGIRLSTDSTNSSCFRNNVEVHVNHIQSCLTQMGNLHAFTSSADRYL